jgi:hypothetical protein
MGLMMNFSIKNYKKIEKRDCILIVSFIFAKVSFKIESYNYLK